MALIIIWGGTICLLTIKGLLFLYFGGTQIKYECWLWHKRTHYKVPGVTTAFKYGSESVP